VVLALSGSLLACCQRQSTSVAPPVASASASQQGQALSVPADAPPGIAWYTGSLEAAFAQARGAGKPVLLYWGAKWCPYCHELKGTVFARADFIEKSRLFVPVYLDGDDPGAQRWGDEFRVTGYPTVLILRSDRSELERVSGGMDLSQYGEVLDLALGDVRPVQDLLASLGGTPAAPLSRDDCRRLAYYGWDLDPIVMTQPAERVEVLEQASEACPPESSIEKARLTATAAVAATAAEQDSLHAGKAPSAQLATLVRRVDSIVAERKLATGTVDVLENLDDSFFTAAKQVVSARRLEKHWIAVIDPVVEDRDLPDMDRLDALQSKLQAVRGLGGSIPAPLARFAEQRIDAVLARPHDENIQAGDVEAALNVLDVLGDTDHAYAVAMHEVQTSKTPYYYMDDVAELEEKRGHKDLAISWFERAYQESRGAATRFQWGTNYVGGLVRMHPEDDARIRSAALNVLGELDGPDRIYSRSRMRLERLDAVLRAWNHNGSHSATIGVLRQRVVDMCVKVPASDPAHGTCAGFLAKA
jgi:thiol-disulfide isomerase/thioredoxin